MSAGGYGLLVVEFLGTKFLSCSVIVILSICQGLWLLGEVTGTIGTLDYRGHVHKA